MTIFLYDGPGVSQECLVHTERSIRRAVPSCEVKRIAPEGVIFDAWETNAALFVLPGGADLPYLAAMQGEGNRKIRSFVEKGGSFLGICAGSYYAGNFVDFGPIQEKRELSFFPGRVKGPILAPFDNGSKRGARAAQLQWVGSGGFSYGMQFTMFYNGGGYFVDAAKCPDVTVLAHYEDAFSPAIIACQVGEGSVILSGVHFEYDPCGLDSEDPYVKPLLSELMEGNPSRLDLVQYLLLRLLKMNPFDYTSSVK